MNGRSAVRSVRIQIKSTCGTLSKQGVYAFLGYTPFFIQMAIKKPFKFINTTILGALFAPTTYGTALFQGGPFHVIAQYWANTTPQI
jgi:hypothetical protein